MDRYLQNCLVFAARYAHMRQTGAALMVCRQIRKSWHELDADIKAQLKREARNEAIGNSPDWAILLDLPDEPASAEQ